MTKNLIISVLAVSLLWAVADVTAAGASKKARPLVDGFILTGIDGKLTSDGNERWLFEFDSDVSDEFPQGGGSGKDRVCAGMSLEVLPSAALEKMASDSGKRAGAGYRLWGRVTKYEGKNFIFPIYFLPLSETNKLQLQQSQQQGTEPAVNEPNDALTIPQEIIAKLATKRVIRPQQLRKGLELKQDCILADRTGFIVRQDDGELVFVLDALGRNVQQISFQLLPCEILERALQKQSAEPDPIRFKAAGIVTKYKDNYYLLLQRATRVYSHGNFAR